jgi:hypothetical protein
MRIERGAVIIVLRRARSSVAFTSVYKRERSGGSLSLRTISIPFFPPSSFRDEMNFLLPLLSVLMLVSNAFAQLGPRNPEGFNFIGRIDAYVLI